MTDHPITNAPLIGRGWVRPNELPLPPTDFAPYEEWVHHAFSYLFGAIDSAVDELQRDRDFLDPDAEDLTNLLSPEGNTRRECIAEAVRRLLAALNAIQEA